MEYFLGLLICVELYYWFWWLPRNYKTLREVDDVIYFVKTMEKLREAK